MCSSLFLSQPADSAHLTLRQLRTKRGAYDMMSLWPSTTHTHTRISDFIPFHSESFIDSITLIRDLHVCHIHIMRPSELINEQWFMCFALVVESGRISLFVVSCFVFGSGNPMPKIEIIPDREPRFWSQNCSVRVKLLLPEETHEMRPLKIDYFRSIPFRQRRTYIRMNATKQ